MSSITIKSGFGRGGRVLRWDGQQWASHIHVAENTWTDDGDDSKEFAPSDGARYAVGTYYTDGHTRVWHWELVGWSEAELATPAPEEGWREDILGASATAVCRVTTLGEWLLATAGGRFLSDATASASGIPHPMDPGIRLARLPYEWGDQSAEHWAVYRDGVLIGEASGCGDRTPEPITTQTGWEFDDAAERRRIALQEEDDARNAMLDRGQQGPWAEVGQHLSSCYKRKLNPLPTLRKEHPGTWAFYAGGHPTTPTAIAWQGDGWTVIHTPAA